MVNMLTCQYDYIVNGYGYRLPQTSKNTFNFLSFLTKWITKFFQHVV